MEKKVSNDGRILETAYNIVGQVNTLLISAANPSDETSLSIRLSLIKVSLYLCTYLSLYIMLKLCYENNNFHLILFLSLQFIFLFFS